MKKRKAKAKTFWCVRHRTGWCVIRGNKPFPEEQNKVETACSHYIIMPCGCEKRAPDCEDCIAAIGLRN